MSSSPPPLPLQAVPRPPPLPVSGPPTMEYATPTALQVAEPAAEPIVEGGLLVGPTEMSLPRRCVKCNGDEARRYSKTYHWHHPFFYLLILGGLLLYAIVALCLQKQGDVAFSLCARHARRRSLFIAGGWIGAAAVIGGAFVGVILCDSRVIDKDFIPYFILGGLFGVVIVALVAAIGARVLKPKRIDEHMMKIGGAGEAFLSSLAYQQLARSR